MIEVCPATITKDKNINRMHPNEVTSPASGSRYHGYADYQGINLRQQFPFERKWALGLQSQAHPRDIMTEVLKALQELNVFMTTYPLMLMYVCRLMILSELFGTLQVMYACMWKYRFLRDIVLKLEVIGSNEDLFIVGQSKIDSLTRFQDIYFIVRILLFTEFYLFQAFLWY